MYFWLDMLNFWFAIAGLAMIPVTVGLYADYFFYKSKYYLQWFHEYVWIAVMAITVGSVAVSLLYSEYFGFVPCSLCWLQRIALYPQALLSILAFKIKDSTYFPLYGIALSIFGFGVALYQYVYQLLPQGPETSRLMPCLADGSADCAVRVINEFGFVTFPLLSAITFALLIILYLNQRRVAQTAL
jgi:disulfide bond formation protein DsbB